MKVALLARVEAAEEKEEGKGEVKEGVGQGGQNDYTHKSCGRDLHTDTVTA